MSAYAEMRDQPWLETVPACALAAFGDAVITIVLYSLVALAFRNWRWWVKGAWKNYATVASLGFVSAVLIERLALPLDIGRMPRACRWWPVLISDCGRFYSLLFLFRLLYG